MTRNGRTDAVCRDGRSDGIDAELALVLSSWAADVGFAMLTVDRMGEIARRFARFATASGMDTFADADAGVCAAFIDATTRSGTRPSINTRHFRRTTIRTLLRTLRQLGFDAPDPTIDLVLPPRTGNDLRPLADDEVVLCRTVTFVAGAGDLRRPAAWALAETTATTSEIAALTTHDIIDHHDAITVQLPGGRTAHPRHVQPTDWATQILRKRLAEIPAGASIVYSGHRPRHSGAAQAAVCNLIGVVLRATALHTDPGVRPGSVRLWRAANEFRTTGSLEDTARLLGARSLDTLARQLGHDWHP